MVLLSLVLVTLSSSNPIARIDSLIKPFSDAHQFSGTVLVARSGKVIFEKGYGKANWEYSIANSCTTRFAVASITKSMTQAIALQMLEQGKWVYTDTINKFLPEFPNGDKITVVHLLNHRAGLPHRVTTLDRQFYPITAELMANYAAKAQQFGVPGEKSVYSSAGYSVLARIIEIIEKKPFDEVLQERIFTPTKMDTAVDATSQKSVANRASSYLPTVTVPAPMQQANLSYLVGAGSVISSARDVLKFVLAVKADRFGKGAAGYILDEGSTYLNGISSGYRTTVDINSVTDTVVIICSNVLTGAHDILRDGIEKILSGEAVKSAAPPKVVPIQLSGQSVAGLQGVWTWGAGPSEMLVHYANGILFIGDSPTVPIAPDMFFAFRDYGTVRIVRNEARVPIEIQWQLGDITNSLTPKSLD